MQKLLFLPLYFHTSFYNQALRLPTPNFYPPTLPQQILWALQEGITPHPPVFPRYSYCPTAPAFPLCGTQQLISSA